MHSARHTSCGSFGFITADDHTGRKQTTRRARRRSVLARCHQYRDRAHRPCLKDRARREPLTSRWDLKPVLTSQLTGLACNRVAGLLIQASQAGQFANCGLPIRIIATGLGTGPGSTPSRAVGRYLCGAGGRLDLIRRLVIEVGLVIVTSVRDERENLGVRSFREMRGEPHAFRYPRTL